MGRPIVKNEGLPITNPNKLTLCIASGLLLLAISPARSQTVQATSAQATTLLTTTDDAFTYSSSATIPDAPSATAATVMKKPRTYRPFSAFAIAFKIGSGGIGGDLATPLTNWANLRVSIQAFDHPLKFRTSGIYSNGDLTIQNAAISADLYPFHNAFRISPGVTVYGDNHLTTSLLVPGGSTFLLGPDGYTSDPNDPVTGYGRIRFGNPVSPRFTVGWGNMLPHSGHFSVPFEFGFQYISPPTVTVSLYGSVCDPMGDCGPVNQGEEQQDLQAEIDELNNDLKPLRFYPILAIGFSYKFGH